MKIIFAAAIMIGSVLPCFGSDGPLKGFPEYDVERNCSLLFPSNNGHFNQWSF